MFFHGNFALLSPLTLLQAMCLEQRSVKITAWRSASEASVAIVEGQILDAHCDSVIGEEAVYRLVLWDFGQFAVEPLELAPDPVTIRSSWQILLQDAARRRDSLDLTPPPPAPYPSRQQIEALLRVSPALGGVAMVGYDGRLLNEMGMPQAIVREAGTLAGALVAANRALRSPQTVTRYVHAGGTLLLADWGLGTLVLATPADEARLEDAVAQLSAGMFAAGDYVAGAAQEEGEA